MRGAALFLAAFAAAVVPPPPLTVSAWAAEQRVVAAESGSPYPGRWSNDLAPYLVEPMDCCSLDHPSRVVSIMASAQVGKTSVLENVFGYVVDRNPSPILIVLPTLEEARKFNRIKLGPLIESTPVLRRKVGEHVSRDEKGSTSFFKVFAGGFAVVTGANTATGLQMISARVRLYDEVDGYPLDVDGRGDPIAQGEARGKAWDQRGSKSIRISTPGVAGHSRIAQEYEAGDQRKFYVACPHCGARQAIEWPNLRWHSDLPPYRAYLVCALNGCVIDEVEKARMVAGGVWLKTFDGGADDPAPPSAFAAVELDDWVDRRGHLSDSRGRQPSFYVWQAYSPFVSWETTVGEYLTTEGDQQRRIAFRQQTLGLPADIEGEAPGIERLMDRRETWPAKRIPPGVLFLVGAVDVQGDRLEWAVYGVDRHVGLWLIDRDVISGDPNGDEAWTALDEVLMGQRYQDAWGMLWPVDRWGIDSGYLTNRVYLYVRRHAHTGRVVALDGRHGWKLPALGKPKTVDFKAAGRKLKIQVSPVGTWDLKSELYGRLRLTIDGPDGDGNWPKGAMRFNQAAEPNFFQQLTAEILVDKARRTGQTVQEWRKTGPNEQHDLAVYCLALAHGEADGLRPDQWAALEAARLRPQSEMQADMAELWSPSLAPQPAAPAKAAAKPAAKAEERPRQRPEGWLPQPGGSWL